MIYKSEVEQLLEKVKSLLVTTNESLLKHTISADQVAKNITQSTNDLERIGVLITREPNPTRSEKK